MITVKALKALLNELPPEDDDLIVFVEGCDCYGLASGVVREEQWVGPEGPQTGLSITREQPWQ